MTGEARSDQALEAQRERLLVDIAVAESQIETASKSRKRTRKLLRGVALTAIGLVFSAPTGGISLVLTALGAIDVVDAAEDDASEMNLQIRLRRDLERYRQQYNDIAAEQARRGAKTAVP